MRPQVEDPNSTGAESFDDVARAGVVILAAETQSRRGSLRGSVCIVRAPGPVAADRERAARVVEPNGDLAGPLAPGLRLATRERFLLGRGARSPGKGITPEITVLCRGGDLPR